MRCRAWLHTILLVLFSAQTAVAAQHPDPIIAIIIDDLGMQHERGIQVATLPAPIACSILPHSPYAKAIARQAHRNGKEVLLHLPMQSEQGHLLEPGALTSNMSRQDMHNTLLNDLASIPHVSGINNHMGSLLTQRPEAMDWLMYAVKQRGQLYFVDSRTTAATVALQAARAHRIPSTRRDVFLDHDPRPQAIRIQLRRLLQAARRHGTALAIGHPHIDTMQVLSEWLPTLASEGVRLVPVASIIERRKHRSHQIWHAYWSPLQKAVKNSKP